MFRGGRGIGVSIVVRLGRRKVGPRVSARLLA